MRFYNNASSLPSSSASHVLPFPSQLHDLLFFNYFLHANGYTTRCFSITDNFLTDVSATHPICCSFLFTQVIHHFCLAFVNVSYVFDFFSFEPTHQTTVHPNINIYSWALLVTINLDPLLKT